MEEVDSMQDDMVEFESRWFRFGGGPSDEIYTRFGMTDRVFFERMNELMVADQGLDHVAPKDAEVMRAVIRRRLWLAS